MPQKFDLADVLAKNPQVDQKELAEALEALRRLREMGIGPRGPRIAPSRGGRRVRIYDGDDQTGARIIRSRHNHQA